MLFWLVTAAILVLALYPRLQLPEPRAIAGCADYLGHFLAFFVLTLLGVMSWGATWRLVVLIAIAAGGLELSQTLSSGRETSLFDFLAGLIGIVLAIGMARLFRLAPSRPAA